MKSLAGKFSFKVPDGHPEAGTKIEKPFEYSECENDAEAVETLKAKKWSIVDMVNDKIKSSARSNAYQNALMPYRPSEVSPEDIKTRMIRDFIRLGVDEATATTQVDALLAAQNTTDAEATA